MKYNRLLYKHIHPALITKELFDECQVAKQGRRPKEVYFSWMRGFVMSAYFLKSISLVFGVDEKNITLVGDDDLNNIETFKRTPKADLEIILDFLNY